MKSLLILLGLSFLLPICLTAEPLHVLIVDGFNNHDWKRTTNEVQNILAEDNDIVVTVSTVPKAGIEAWKSWNPDFTKYDVVIQNTNDIKKGA